MLAVGRRLYAVATVRLRQCVTTGVTPRSNSRYNLKIAAMRSNGYISSLLLRTCWIEGRACPRRYLSVLPSHMRANLFGGD